MAGRIQARCQAIEEKKIKEVSITTFNELQAEEKDAETQSRQPIDVG